MPEVVPEFDRCVINFNMRRILQQTAYDLRKATVQLRLAKDTVLSRVCPFVQVSFGIVIANFVGVFTEQQTLKRL